MKRLIALNTSRGTVVADRVGVAMTRAERAVGLLSRTGLEPGEALWIIPSRGVHTWGMRFTIDVLALDEEGIVIDCVSNLKPWRVRLPRKGTAGVLELPAGRLAESGTGLGHRILFETTEAPLSRLDAARRDPERVEGPRPLTQPQELAG
jgi:uncharacterized protein